MRRTKFPDEPNNAIRVGSVRTFLDALVKIDPSDKNPLLLSWPLKF